MNNNTLKSRVDDDGNRIVEVYEGDLNEMLHEASKIREMDQEYEKDTLPGNHTIESEHVMVCSETGRVIAVFYNDYDLEDVLSKLNGRSDR